MVSVSHYFAQHSVFLVIKGERTPVNSNALCMIPIKLRQIRIEIQNYQMETPPTLGKKDLIR